jgi:(4-O-methyl)-D-glucuronate---lignin esterase
MHLRRLALTTLTLPFVLAACSSDRKDDGDVSGFTEPTPTQGTGEQPPGSGEAPGGVNETPSTPSTPAEGTGEGIDPDTELQQPGEGAEPTAGDGTPVTEPVPFNCVLPELPDPQNLTYLNEKLPDPFTFLDGTKVTTREQWDCRRKEILAIAAKYLYAPIPPAPDAVSGTVNGGAISIAVTVGATTANFTANVTGQGEAIVVGGNIPGGNRSLSFGAGFEGQIQNLFGFSELNNNIARGWMIDRVMDVLEQNPDSGLDPQRLVVTGCSGCGKGSLLTGVFSRVPVTVIIESGGGGATSFRQVEWFRNGEGQSVWTCPDGPPQGIDNLEDDGACRTWVQSAARFFRDNPERIVNLPMDQHLLLATIAPRYVVHFTNDNGNGWCHLAGTSEALAAYAAKPVWNALGVPERMGFQMYNAGHCGASDAQTSLIGEMLKLAFFNDTTANTNVLNILPDGVQQPVSEWDAMWIDWNKDTILQ